MVDKGKTGLEKAATWDYLKYLDEPAQQATWHLGTGYTPIRKTAVKDPEVAARWQRRPAFRVAYDQLLASKSGKGPIIGAYKEFREAIVASLERVVIRNEDPKKALEQAEKDADAAMTSYNDRVGG
jgi:sn-glycerol 3-phosphate transport system substrate-binding protein